MDPQRELVTDLASRLAELERRVRDLEDRPSPKSKGK